MIDKNRQKIFAAPVFVQERETGGENAGKI